MKERNGGNNDLATGKKYRKTNIHVIERFMRLD
jgi:hypothetical protein